MPDSPWIRFPRAALLAGAWFLLSSMLLFAGLDKDFPAWAGRGMELLPLGGSAFLFLAAVGLETRRDRIVMVGLYGTLACALAWVVSTVAVLSAASA